MMTRPDAPSWAEVATRCGHADRSHLDRDLRDLAGPRPSDFVPA